MPPHPRKPPAQEVKLALGDFSLSQDHSGAVPTAPTCLHQPVSAIQPSKLSCIFDDEEVEWNVRVLILDVRLAFHFIYTRDIVTLDLIFHCIFSLR